MIAVFDVEYASTLINLQCIAVELQQVVEKHQHELRKLDEAKEKDLERPKSLKKTMVIYIYIIIYIFFISSFMF